MKPAQDRTKVVVRKLPPGLTEEAFKTAVDKILPSGSYDWFSYHQGKVSLKKLVFSRAYLNFVDPKTVFTFKAGFDGRVFVTTKGTQYKCAVEYAPYQKIPQPGQSKNPWEGSIEQDPEYQSFLKQLEEGPELLPSAAIQREQQDKDRAAAAGNPGTAYGAVIVTPLMAYLKEKYSSSSSGIAAAKKRRVESEAKKRSEDGKQRLDKQASKKAQAEEEQQAKKGKGNKASSGNKGGHDDRTTPTATAAISADTAKFVPGSKPASAPKLLAGKLGGSSGGGGARDSIKEKHQSHNQGPNSSRTAGKDKNRRDRKDDHDNVHHEAQEPSQHQQHQAAGGNRQRGAPHHGKHGDAGAGQQAGAASSPVRGKRKADEDSGSTHATPGNAPGKPPQTPRQPAARSKSSRTSMDATANAMGNLSLTPSSSIDPRSKVNTQHAAASTPRLSGLPRSQTMPSAGAASPAGTGASNAVLAKQPSGDGPAAAADDVGGPPRRVRAGFQAYRPPSSRTSGRFGGDNRPADT